MSSAGLPAGHPLRGVLESALYCDDLEAAEAFYSTVLGLEPIARQAGRHSFYRCGGGVVLLFNPKATIAEPVHHGAEGPGHIAFRVAAAELPGWRAQLQGHNVAIEREVSWPGGGLSVYFRDPAGNSLELATPATWGIPEDSDSEPAR